MANAPTVEIGLEQFSEIARGIEAEVGKVIVGQQEVVRSVIICVLAGGHALLEGVPGLGKTMLIRTLGDVLDLKFSRIQFTPDLMPADIVGTDILEETEDGRRQFRFQAGPIFANLVLADEINRATPKTQSAMLEAMQEKTVTVAGRRYDLQLPFFVLATQNPLEMEGTYPLPEAQLDRFLFKVDVRFPGVDELAAILERTTGIAMPRAGKVADGRQVIGMGAAGARRAHSIARQPIRRPRHRRHSPRQRRSDADAAELCPLWRQPAWRPGPDHRRKDQRVAGRPLQCVL